MTSVEIHLPTEDDFADWGQEWAAPALSLAQTDDGTIVEVSAEHAEALVRATPWEYDAETIGRFVQFSDSSLGDLALSTLENQNLKSGSEEEIDNYLFSPKRAKRELPKPCHTCGDEWQGMLGDRSSGLRFRSKLPRRSRSCPACRWDLDCQRAATYAARIHANGRDQVFVMVCSKADYQQHWSKKLRYSGFQNGRKLAPNWVLSIPVADDRIVVFHPRGDLGHPEVYGSPLYMGMPNVLESVILFNLLSVPLATPEWHQKHRVRSSDTIAITHRLDPGEGLEVSSADEDDEVINRAVIGVGAQQVDDVGELIDEAARAGHEAAEADQDLWQATASRDIGEIRAAWKRRHRARQMAWLMAMAVRSVEFPGTAPVDVRVYRLPDLGKSVLFRAATRKRWHDDYKKAA